MSEQVCSFLTAHEYTHEVYMSVTSVYHERLWYNVLIS